MSKSAQAKETVAADAGANKAVAEEAPAEAPQADSPVGDTTDPTSNAQAACVTCGSDRDLFTTDGISADLLTFCAKHRPANQRA